MTSTQLDTVSALVRKDADVLATEGVPALAQTETDRGPDGVLVQVVAAGPHPGPLVYSSEAGRMTPGSTLRPLAGATSP